MSSKDKAVVETPKVRLQEDPTVVFFCFLRAWRRADGTAVLNKTGEQVVSIGPRLAGGGWRPEYAGKVDEMLASGQIDQILNHSVVVGRINAYPRTNARPTIVG